MKFFFSLVLFSTVAIAEVKLAQTCEGINQYNEVVKTQLFLEGFNEEMDYNAKLLITHKDKEKEVLGVLTAESDLLGSRMFKNTDDSLRYLTSGLLMDMDDYSLRLNMKCSKFKK